MCRKGKYFALVMAAFGMGIVLASICPSWLLVWVLGIACVVISIYNLQ